MVFSSTIFVFLFLPVVLGGYYLIRHEFRNTFLLVSSLLFYAWGEPKFVFIMIASILVNYCMGIAIDVSRDWRISIKRFILIVAILLNLGLLFYFKYFDFAVDIFNGLFKSNISLRHIALPIGISFFTFQGMSYILDLYMGKVEVQNNPLNIALYIALFPQLIAGPIVRYIDVNEQIESRTCTSGKFNAGIKRFIMGLAKKIILANSVATIADSAFSTQVSELSSIMSWLGIICYTFQIYFDFCGYSDMAIGLGQIFGFEFLENFNYPYTSKNITEFWRRWHISLSSWFRDYVYIPLGGNRTGNVYFNLLTVFFVTGLWHGASWNFIIWGLWHGFFLIVERILRRKDADFKTLHLLKRVYTLLVVIIGWVMFRAPDINYGLLYIKSMFNYSFNSLQNDTACLYFKDNFIILMICAVLCTPLIKILKDKFSDYKACTLFEIIIYMVLFIISISYMVNSSYDPFIYFNF